jgi:hypothetical protein
MPYVPYGGFLASAISVLLSVWRIQYKRGGFYMSIGKIAENTAAVIVRAWGNEPVPLVAYGMFNHGKWVLVGKKGAKRPIGMPVEDVFDYEGARLARLSDAYSRRDFEALDRLYSDLRMENKSSEGACNKYQYLLKSLNHEKTKVANTRSPEDSGQQ